MSFEPNDFTFNKILKNANTFQANLPFLSVDQQPLSSASIPS